MATFTGTSGNDSFTGTSAADTFNFAVVNLGSGDTVMGGDGSAIDVLNFTTAGTVTANALSGVSGIEKIVFGKNGTNAITLTNALVSSAYNQLLSIVGSDGDDTIDGSALTPTNGYFNRIAVTAGKGDDTIKGGTGDDLFEIAADDLTKADTIAGGGGYNTLKLTTAGTIDLSGVTAVGTILLANGTNSLTLYDPAVSSASDVYFSIHGGSGADTIDASRLKSHRQLVFYAGGGDDTLMGGPGNDSFDFSASELHSTDSVDGGSGSDTLNIIGSGTANLVNVRRVEQIYIYSGVSSSSSMSVKLSDATVSSATNGRIAFRIIGSNVTVDASKLTGTNAIDAQVLLQSPDATLTGGAGDDSFTFFASSLENDDTVAGGGGTDTLTIADGGTITANQLAGVSGIEKIVLDSGHNNSITLPNTLAKSGTLAIQGGAANDVIDGSAIAGASLDITPGSGSDTLTGGSGDDTFRFAGTGLTSADHIDGGAGNDTLALATPGSANLANVRGIENITLADGGANTIVLNNDMVSSATGARVAITGGSGDDTINASKLSSYNAVDIVSSAGNDTLLGGKGADTFTMRVSDLTSADTIKGGGGADTLKFVTGGTISLDALANVTGIARIVFANVDTSLTVNNSFLANTPHAGGQSNRVLYVVGGAGNDIVDGSQLDSSNGVRNELDVTAGGGNDTLTGGAGFDTFRFAGSALTADDKIDGGGSTNNQLIFSSAGSADLANVRNVQYVELAAGTSSVLLSNGLAVSDAGHLHVYGAAGNETIDGRNITQNHFAYDAAVGADTVYGGAGADQFTFGYTNDQQNFFDTSDSIDGGGGLDTLTLYSSGTIATSNVRNVENIVVHNDGLGGVTQLTLNDATVASASGHKVTATASSDTSFAVLDGSGVTSTSNALTLIGHGYDDTLIAGAGTDTLTGDASDTSFEWLHRDGSFDHVTNFSGGNHDKLAFAAPAFDYNGTAFDTEVTASSTSTDITGADLVVYTGGTLNSVADVQAYLGAAVGGSVDEGLFIAGTNSAGDTVLYHALDASFAHSTNVAAIADLGTITKATALTTGMFTFV